jgi:hypothetical protein
MLDKALEGQNVGVTVRDRVATLWGSMPSAALARQAVQRVGQLPGLVAVRNELQIEGTMDRLDEPCTSHASTWRPSRVKQTRTDEPPTESTLARRWGERSRPAVEESLWKPGRAQLQGQVPVADTPASPVERTRSPGKLNPGAVLLPPVGSNAASDRANQIDVLRRKDVRYIQIEPDVRGGVVYLRGAVHHWEDLLEFAQSISALPWVERVILQDVRADPNRTPAVHDPR